MMSTKKFSLKQKQLIDRKIEKIIFDATKKIQQIGNIDKYQMLFGKIDATTSKDKSGILTNYSHCENYLFHSQSYPDWSHPFIFEMAYDKLKEPLHAYNCNVDNLRKRHNAVETLEELNWTPRKQWTKKKD